VDNTLASAARWYTGSGIYRHAWLQVVNLVHVATWGTYVTTPVVKEASAEVKIVTTIDNTSEHIQTATVSQSIVNATGKPQTQLKEQKVTLAAKAKTNVEQILQLANPKLWTLEEPTLYDMVTTIKVGSKVVDSYHTSFGVRTVRFDKDKGFFLNGKHIKLQGMCLHQDAGILGTAIPDRSYERRLQIIKAYGCDCRC
jgi:beta-galactosidase